MPAPISFSRAAQIMVHARGDAHPLERLLPDVRCTVIRAGWFPAGPEWNLPERVLPHYVLFVCVSGAADFHIGDSWHRVGPNMLLLIPPNVPHRAHHDPESPFRHCGYHFFARLHGVVDIHTLYGLPLLFHPLSEVTEQIVRLMESMVDELAAGGAAYTLAANGICAHILALLCREAAASRHPHQDPVRNTLDTVRVAQLVRLAPVFQTIHTRYAGPLSLGEMAGLVHLHPAYLSTLFRQATGLPLVRYLARYRLDRARELLVSTDLPITEIALAVGYSDLAYFDRIFRRATDLSPSEYRRSKKNPTVP